MARSFTLNDLYVVSEARRSKVGAKLLEVAAACSRVESAVRLSFPQPWTTKQRRPYILLKVGSTIRNSVCTDCHFNPNKALDKRGEIVRITFDSNVWRPVGDPSRSPNDPEHGAFKVIHSALAAGTVVGLLSDTVFTLEGIARSDRKNFLGQYSAKITTKTTEQPGGIIKVSLSIGPDLDAHPGNNSCLSSHLNDALALNFKLMHCPRVAGISNSDLKESWYFASEQPFDEVSNRFGEVGRRIQTVGAGMHHIQEIAKRYVSPSKLWSQGLAAAPTTEDRAIAAAVAEWADGDMVAAHVAYGNHYICTRDSAKGAGSTSVFSPANRAWLANDYGVRFVSPTELAALA